MLTIQIHLTCPASNGLEILSTELEIAELMVEDLVSRVLLELFGVVIVEKVKISFIEEDHCWRDTFPEVV